MWLTVLDAQFEVCFIISLDFLQEFAVLHQDSTLTLICVHNVSPERILRTLPDR